MLALAPAVAALDRHRRLAQHWVNNVWAKVSTFPFYRIEIQGAATPLLRVATMLRLTVVPCCARWPLRPLQRCSPALIPDIDPGCDAWHCA